MHKESYRNQRQNATPGHIAPEPSRIRVNKEAIKLAAARDNDLSKHCHRALEALLFLAGVRDEIDVSDNALSALMSAEGEDEAVSPASVRGLLARLEQRGYIEVARKRKGCPERHIELRNPARARRTSETRSQARNNEHENCAGPTQNPSSREETQYKETPNARVKRAASDSESLKSESLSPEPPTLDELMDEGRAEAVRRQARFCERRCAVVVNTAQSLDDAEGAPHYEVYYHQHAGEDNDLWLKALCQAHRYLAQDHIDGPTARHYFEKIVFDLAKKKAASDAQRQRQAKADQRAEDAAREAVEKAVVTPTSQATVADPDLDAKIAADPFADVQEQVEEAPSPAPAPEFHPAVVKAIAVLKLQVRALDLQAIFDGACKGREAVFALGVSIMKKGGVCSPLALISKVAAEHRDKDDLWLRARAKGVSTAACTQIVVEFEERLEAEKQAHNVPISDFGGFHSDGPVPAGDLFGNLLRTATKQAEQIKLVPKVADDAKSAALAGFVALPADERRRLQQIGYAWADKEMPAGVTSALREAWRSHGVYLAYVKHAENAARTENARRAQAVDQEAHQDVDEEDPSVP